MDKLGLNVLRVDDSGEATAKCPEHVKRTGREDRHPSFSVNIESGLFGCWSCQYRGEFVTLVKDQLELDHADAVAWIRAQGTIQRVERILANRDTTSDTTEEINEAKLALYVSPPPKALQSRRLTAEACARHGVLWDAENKRWITPIRDTDGTLLGWQEKNRRYFKNRPKGLKKAQHLFGLWVLPKRCDFIVVVESPLDAVRLAGLGFHAVASYGASISDAQMRLIHERTNRLILFPDNDSAGRIARDKILAIWTRRGLAILIVVYAKLLADLHRDVVSGLDPGDLAAEEACLLIDQAIPSSIAALTFR
ncbi:toprim domain-containing protein [Nonomuraea typhae]|uniref:Toprim domain-containing protein n=1 Tax=Nonomuraea typhae TaxID=2603600 RepID=A0ABW7YJN0_9ACTN